MLNADLSAGPDGLPPILFKELKHSFAKPKGLAKESLSAVVVHWLCAR